MQLFPILCHEGRNTCSYLTEIKMHTFASKLLLLCQILTYNFYNVSDFKVKCFQRVRFCCKTFTTRQILHAMKKLKRQIWTAFVFLKRQVFTHFLPWKRQILHLRYIIEKISFEAKIFTPCQILK